VSDVRIRLSIEPELCGPLSMGTVAVVKLLSRHLALPLRDVLALVDRCVFDAEVLELPVPSRKAALDLVESLSSLRTPAKVHAEVLG
jgi:hypothetical protein